MRWALLLGVGNSGQGLLDLVDAADAELVPVEELVLEPREGLVGLFARRVFVTDPVDDRLQHREPRGVAVGLGLVAPLEQRMDVGEQLRLALCCHEHVRGLKAERAGIEDDDRPGRRRRRTERSGSPGRLDGRRPPVPVRRCLRIRVARPGRMPRGAARVGLVAAAAIGFIRGCLRPLVRGDGLVDQTRQLDRFLDAVVVFEAQDRRESRLQPRRHAGLEEARRVDQAPERLLPLGLGPHDRHKDRGAAASRPRPRRGAP